MSPCSGTGIPWPGRVRRPRPWAGPSARPCSADSSPRSIMVTLSEPVAKFALTFSTPEYFAIVLFGLTSVVSLGGGSLTNAFISLFFGLLIAYRGRGCDLRHAPVRLRFSHPDGRHRVSDRHGGRLRRGGGPDASGRGLHDGSGGNRGLHEDQDALPQRGLGGLRRPFSGVPSSARSSASFPAPGPPSPPLSPTAWRPSTENEKRKWAPAFPRGSWPPRRRPPPPSAAP